MSEAAASQVTVNRSWYEGDRFGRLRQRVLDVTLNLSSQGGATNYIAASILGLQEIYEAGPFVADGQLVFIAAPSYDRTKLYIYNIEVTTDANRADPVDITDIIRGIVKGKPL